MSDIQMDDAEIDWREKLRKEEILSFKTHISGEIPLRPAWVFNADLQRDADLCFRQIIEIMGVIFSTPYNQWPEDDKWRDMLPTWFVGRTPTFTPQEAEALMASIPRNQWHLLPWDFGSWLDALRVREWHWWSYKRTEDHLVVYLKLTSWPAQLEAFVHILRAAGATVTQSASI